MSRPILSHEAQIDYLRDGAGAPDTGNGAAKDTSRFTDKRIQIVLAGAWDIDIEGSVDGTTWVTVTGAGNLLAGSVIIEEPLWWRFMRIVSNVVGTDAEYSVHLGGLAQGDWE